MTKGETLTNYPVRDITKYEPYVTSYDGVSSLQRSENLSDGLHVITHEDCVHTEILFEDLGADTTVVIFNGAGFSGSMTRPGFTGTSMMKFFPEDTRVNRVYVHDASLYKDPTNSLTWYAGFRGLKLQDELPKILARFLRGTRAIFFGVSGGAFAALYFSSRFPRSAVMATNPQIILHQYGYHDWAYEKYCRTCWGATFENGEKVELADCFVGDLSRIYSSPVDNLVYYLINSSDHHHIEDHLVPFADNLDPQNNVQLVLRNWGKGHVAPPPDYFIAFLAEIVRSPDWSAARSIDNSQPLPAIESVEALRNLLPETSVLDLISDEVSLQDEELRFDLPEGVWGTLDISAEIIGEIDAPLNSAMLSLLFRDRHTVPSLSAIHLSQNADLGHFVYLRTGPAVAESKLKIYLPREAECVGFVLRNWHPTSEMSPLIVRKLTIAVSQ